MVKNFILRILRAIGAGGALGSLLGFLSFCVLGVCLGDCGYQASGECLCVACLSLLCTFPFVCLATLADDCIEGGTL